MSLDEYKNAQCDYSGGCKNKRNIKKLIEVLHTIKPNSIPEVYKSENKENIILHVGRLDVNQKRSDLLVEFWSKLHLNILDWKFVIIGNGPYFKTLKDRVDELKLPRMYLKGYQKPESFYEKSKIFMMPSAYEGFPNTIIEAQSYGCIPFAFNSYAGLEWIVNDNKDAFLSPAFDVNDMVNKMAQLCKNEIKMEKISGKALVNAEKFIIENVGKYWFNLFDNFV